MSRRARRLKKAMPLWCWTPTPMDLRKLVAESERAIKDPLDVTTVEPRDDDDDEDIMQLKELLETAPDISISREADKVIASTEQSIPSPPVIELEGEIEAGEPEAATTMTSSVEEQAAGYDVVSLLPPSTPEPHDVEARAARPPGINILQHKEAHAWQKYIFDCETEADDKSPALCRGWARSGLCTHHKPTMFLFCRKTCLCTGPQ